MISANTVAPYAGAWIEIIRVKGAAAPPAVAPYAGAWIEMNVAVLEFKAIACRSLRGSVD